MQGKTSVGFHFIITEKDSCSAYMHHIMLVFLTLCFVAFFRLFQLWTFLFPVSLRCSSSLKPTGVGAKAINHPLVTLMTTRAPTGSCNNPAMCKKFEIVSSKIHFSSYQCIFSQSFPTVNMSKQASDVAHPNLTVK